MNEKMKRYLEPNRRIRIAETAMLVILIIGTLFGFIKGFSQINSDPGQIAYQGTVEMERDFEAEDYDEDSTVCDVIYVNGEKKLIVSYPYDQYAALEADRITAYEYRCDNGTSLFFDHRDPDKKEVADTYRQIMAEEQLPVFNLGISLFTLAISLCVVLFFGSFFTTYEKIWFMTIMILATVFAIAFPEESANGVNGIVIMLLYLLDTFLNILCELLISKQSRYNFLVSVLVEITEIVICIVLMYRFATMVTTLFFWLPIDILSFINWTRHKDDMEDELTVVRRLKGYQEVLVLLGIALWTIVVGYLISGLDISTDFYGGNRNLEIIVTYIDACASAVGVANGLFIFFRLREQWIVWYVCAILEGIINVMTGQYVLLILKLGYITNTTYGYIRWSRYIATHKEAEKSLF